MPAPTAMPMDEDELEALAALLDAHAWPHGGMSLEMLDGFFSALVVGPELVLPSEYLPHVWGEAPEWETFEQAQQAIESLMRFWNHIVWRVGQPIPDDPDELDDGLRLMPCLAMPEALDTDETGELDLQGVPDDFPLGGLWAAGFQQGMQLRLDAWLDWLETHGDFAEDLARVQRLAVLNRDHARALDFPQDDVPDFRQRLEECLYLPQMLEQMHLQRLDDRRPRPIRREAAPGRNDPCPCGSGRKFKKCCGGAGQLH
jgi:uncharacterized protein